MTTLHLGWLKDKENKGRLRNLSISAGLLLGVVGFNPELDPIEVDNTSWIQVDDQGNTNSCAGFAFAQCAETCEFYQTGSRTFHANGMVSYVLGQRSAGFVGDVGCTLEGVIRAARRYGIASEQIRPFTGIYDSNVPQNVLDEAKNHTLTGLVELTSYDEIVSFLARREGGVFAALEWLTGHRDCDGVIEKNKGWSLGGHAVSLTGYSRRRDRKGRPYLWLTNSHSRRWANRGHAECAPDAVTEWIRTYQGIFYGITRFNPFTRIKPRLISLI